MRNTTIIENRWYKETNGKALECRVFWHYSNMGKETPRIYITGYNPFPFFASSGKGGVFEGLPTTRAVFDSWMEENGWTKLWINTDVYSHISR